MPVHRVKELVQEGLRRKLSGDLQGAADIWAEALRMDATNRRAAEGLGELKLAGIVPLPPSSTPTPALGLAIPQAGPGSKDPFAKPAEPRFESTPSPFAPPGATPLSMVASPKPAEAAPSEPFASSATTVFGGAPAAPAPPSLTPSPFESSHTMAFGMPSPGAPKAAPQAAAPLPSPAPPAFASSHTMAFGMPAPGLPPAAPAVPESPPQGDRPLGLPLTFERSGFPYDLESTTLEQTVKAAAAHKPTPTPGTPLPFEPEPFEGARRSALAVPVANAIPEPPEEGTSATLVFGGAARPAPANSAPPAAARPATTLEFGLKQPAQPADAPRDAMAFGFRAPAGVMPQAAAATSAPRGPGADGVEAEPLVASGHTMAFGAGAALAPPAPTPAAPAPAPFASSGTMVMGLKVTGPGLQAPAVLLERGKMPSAFNEPDAPKTSPFGQSSLADQALMPPPKPKTSPFGNASLAREALRGASADENPQRPAAVMDPVGTAFDFQPELSAETPAAPAAAAPIEPPAPAPQAAPAAPEGAGSWSFTPLSMVQPKPAPASLPNFTPLSMVRPAEPGLTPMPAPVPGLPRPAAPGSFTPLSMVKPAAPKPQAAPTLTPTALVAPTAAQPAPGHGHGHGAPALPRPVPAPPAAAPAPPSEEVEVDLDIDVEESAPVVASAAAPAPPPQDPNDVGGLLLKAADLLDLDDYTGAMAEVEQVLQLDPSNATAQELRGRCEATLLAMTESKLGDLTRRPKTLMTPDQIVWLNIDHRAGFLLSMIDGTVSLEEIFMLSSMPRLETAKLLLKLLQEKAIR